MTRNPTATTAWVAERMRTLGRVTAVEVHEPNILRIIRREYAPYVAGILSEAVVVPSNVTAVLAINPAAEIVVNVPVESKWSGAAITVAQESRVAWGGLKDLMSVAGDEYVRDYKRDEYQFAERLLGQFRVVERVEREADRLWTLHRKWGLAPLSVLALNPYELTGDCLRTARERYGQFNVVFLNNPNGKATASAVAVAQDLEVPILMAGDLRNRVVEP